MPFWLAAYLRGTPRATSLRILAMISSLSSVPRFSEIAPTTGWHLRGTQWVTHQKEQGEMPYLLHYLLTY